MLQGDKVILRGIRREDLPLLWQFHNDLELELAGGGDPPMPQSLTRLEADFDREAANGGRDGASFAIEADGILIGRCVLRNFDHTNQTCELGIGIGNASYRDRGYGGDALRVLLDYAFRLRNVRKVWLVVNADNPRAMRLYTARGFVEEGRFRQHVWSNGRYIDLVQMGLLRDEWQPR